MSIGSSRRCSRTGITRRPNSNGQRGLHVIASWLEFREALDRFRERAPRDRHSSAGELVHALFDPVAARAGKDSWVEMSPPVIKVADHLAEALPTARFIHMARDGRDVASSVVKRGWGPNDLISGISWWADEMIAAQHAVANVAGERRYAPASRISRRKSPRRRLSAPWHLYRGQ